MLKLPCVFANHAVLQHSRTMSVWGWAEAGQRVTVLFRDQSASATAEADGRFSVRIASGSPGGPFDLVFQVGEETITVSDVLVGEVWLCSGQSNMAFLLRDSTGAEDEIAQARHSKLRLMTIQGTTANQPQSKVLGQWKCCTPESAAVFSGVGYHFGKRLHQSLSVPVGLIFCAVGGTTAENWTSRQALEADPDLAHLVDVAEIPVPYVDAGIAPEAASWSEAQLDESEWKTMAIPQTLKSGGLEINGAVWFRKTIDVPERWAGKSLVLSLDVIDDFDQTFFNGVKVGSTGLETPSFWSLPRRYTLPGDLVKAGKNVIAVRVFDHWGLEGGMLGNAQKMFVALQDDEGQRIELAGEWVYRVELALPIRAPMNALNAMSLYNGMIHPLAPFALAGAIWYQGEGNVSRAFEYRTLFPAMIRSWREAWGDEFWFLFVLLAGYNGLVDKPGESKIAELRDAQVATLTLPRTAAASAIDLGDPGDIHPKNKKDVGERLAAAALGRCYGQKCEWTGPVLTTMEEHGQSAVLHFKHAEGLHVVGEEAKGFAVAGAQGEFHWAKAEVQGNTVVLSCDAVGRIEQVRYNWSDCPVGNLFNAEGLPMMPFRTDDRPYTTAPVAEQYGRLG